jgi:hypothetical protein
MQLVVGLSGWVGLYSAAEPLHPILCRVGFLCIAAAAVIFAFDRAAAGGP